MPWPKALNSGCAFSSSVLDLTVKQVIIFVLILLKIIQIGLQILLVQFSYEGTSVRFVYYYCLIICTILLMGNLVASYLHYANKDCKFKHEKKILIGFTSIYLIVIGAISLVGNFYVNDRNESTYPTTTQEDGLGLILMNSTIGGNFSDDDLLYETFDTSTTAEVLEIKSSLDREISDSDVNYIKIIISIPFVLCIQGIIYILTIKLGSKQQADLESGTIDTNIMSEKMPLQLLPPAPSSSKRRKQILNGNLIHRICKKFDVDDSELLDEVSSVEEIYEPLPTTGSSKESGVNDEVNSGEQRYVILSKVDFSKKKSPKHESTKESVPIKISSSQDEKKKVCEKTHSHCCEDFHQLSFPAKEEGAINFQKSNLPLSKGGLSIKAIAFNKDNPSKDFHKLPFPPMEDDRCVQIFPSRKDDAFANFHVLVFPPKKKDDLCDKTSEKRC